MTEALATATLNDRRQDKRRPSPTRQPEHQRLIVDTHTVLEAADIRKSASWVTRTVRAYERTAVTGTPYGLFLAARLQLSAERRAKAIASNPDLINLLSYHDPTGETATRNVTNERGF